MKKQYFILSILCLIFISLNLRAPITAIGPIANEIMNYYKLDSTSFGFLSSIPLFCFFIFSLIAPMLMRTKAIFLAIIFIFIGLISRSFFNSLWLFLGTALIGVGIAILNVLMPSFVKRNFKNIPKTMAIYGLCLSLSSLIGVFAHHLLSVSNINIALVAWVFFTIIALMLFLPFVKNNRLKRKNQTQNFSNFINIFKNKKAWIITAFMGLQSCVFYTVITWYPSILINKFNSAEFATNLTLLFQFCAVFSAYFIPNFMGTCKNKSLLLIFVCTCNITSFFICLFSDLKLLLILSAMLFSIPVGGIFGVALSMIATKAKDAQTVVYLSSMAQSIGYLIAALGPIIFGFLFNINQNFNLSIIFMILISTLLLIFSLLSNKISYI